MTCGITQVEELRKRTNNLPDDYLVVFAGAQRYCSHRRRMHLNVHRHAWAKLRVLWLMLHAGDLITEEALPTYMTMLNTLDGVRDETGASKTPWATWTRCMGGRAPQAESAGCHGSRADQTGQELTAHGPAPAVLRAWTAEENRHGDAMNK